jgi:hypothetical protein
MSHLGNIRNAIIHTKLRGLVTSDLCFNGQSTTSPSWLSSNRIVNTLLSFCYLNIHVLLITIQTMFAWVTYIGGDDVVSCKIAHVTWLSLCSLWMITRSHNCDNYRPLSTSLWEILILLVINCPRQYDNSILCVLSTPSDGATSATQH